MRISLNLATRPYADLRPAIKRLRIAMAALALVACALGFGLHELNTRADQARAREQALDTQIAAVRQQQLSYQRLMQQPDNARLLAQVAALNLLFEEKAFSWTLAMEDLETVLPGGVQVSTLEPVRAKNGVITLHLRVVGPRDLDVNLVKNLEHSRRFLFPRIVGETADAGEGFNQQHLQPVSASNRVDFDLLAEYNPPQPGEYKVPEQKQTADAGAPDKNPSADQTPPALPSGAHRVRPPYTGMRRRPVRIAKPTPDGGGAR